MAVHHNRPPAKKVSKEKVVLYVGRLEESQKRVSRVIDVWRILSATFIDWRLEIVSDGPDRKTYEMVAAGLPRIHFAGFVSPVEYCAKAKILLLTSDFEGFPLVLCEAMSNGCVPVALGSYAAAYDVVTDCSGVVVDTPWELDRFCAEAMRLMRDGEYWQRLSNVAKHRVVERIVSVTQPYIRPIVRGKAKAPVEFGAKYDVSVDERGHARLEHIDFEPYNECTILQDVIERYKVRTGHCPKRVQVDLVYRTRGNRAFCEERGIEMQKRKPGRKPKDAKERRKLEKKERRNDADRIEVERFFSVEKRCCGAGLIMTKLSKTTLGSIALSVLVANLFGVELPLLFLFYFMDAPDEATAFHMLEIEDEAA